MSNMVSMLMGGWWFILKTSGMTAKPSALLTVFGNVIDAEILFG